MKINSNIIKILPVFLLVAAGVFLFSANGAYALDCWISPTCWISSILNWVLYVVIQILGWFLGMAGELANWSLSPPGGSIIRSEVVMMGWGISRDFANMFFILILLGIALDFILFNSFKVKQMLPRLLLIALLINFSLPIAGVVLDFANVFTQFFIGKMVPATGGTGVTEGIAQSLNLADMFTAKNVAAATFNSDNASNALFLNMVFAIIFTFGTFFIFLAMALMFFIRTGYLYILLTILPIVLVLHAFPPTQGYFGKWSNKFISWTMFAPIATFFIYLAATYLNSATNQNFTKILTDQNIDYLPEIYTYIIAWVFLGGSLVVGQQMGIHLGKISMDSAKTMNKWTRGKLSSAGKGIATSAGRKVGADAQLEKLASGLQKIPGFGMVASGVRGLGAKTKTAMEKREEPTAAEKAKWAGMSDSALAQEQAVHEKSKLPGSGAKAAHIASMRAKNGKLKVLDEHGELDIPATRALVRSSYKAAKTHKNKAAMQAILQSNPLEARENGREEWTKDAQEGKVAGAVMSMATHQIISGKNSETGKTFEDAQKDVFDINQKDFENLKGQWDQNSVKEFIESGHLTRAHLRVANEISDGNFTSFVAKYYSDIDGMATGPARQTAIANIKKLNPGLTNTYIAGNLTEVGLGAPDSITTGKIDEWKK